MLPTTAHLDRLATPDAGGAVEVEESAGAIARGLFDDEVTVEHDGLQTRQQIVLAVDVRPAHLRATDQWIGEEVDELAQAIRLGNEVGVEDGEQFALGRLVSVLERAGFEASAIGAMNVVNIETLRGVFRDCGFGDADCFVSRVVEHLNLQLLARIVDCGNRFEQTIDDVQLVEEWKLNGDSRQFCFGESAAGPRDEFAITPEVDDLLDAISAVDGERAKIAK